MDKNMETKTNPISPRQDGGARQGKESSSMNVTTIAADENQLILWVAKIPRIFMSTLRTLLLDHLARVVMSKSLGSVLEYLQNISRHV